MNPDEPEVLRIVHALGEPAWRPPKNHPPIQPQFTWWPWGFQAAAVPLAAFAAAVFASALARIALPSWPAACVFFLVLGAGNGNLLARAVGESSRQKALTLAGAAAGVLAVCLFYSTHLAAYYAVFLFVFVAVRSILRLGSLAALFFISIFVTSLIIFVVLRAVFGETLYDFVNDPLNQFILGTVVAYPFVCSACTACMPVEVHPKGVVEALLSGVRAALLGLLFGDASFLLLKQVLEFPGARGWPEPLTIQISAVVGGVAMANYVCIRHLFNLAVLGREGDTEKGTADERR